MADKRIRVLVAKPGLDGHDRGAKVIARALRDAGMEVIYTGLRQTVEQIVEAADAEDVDVVALSLLSGAHNTLFPEVVEALKAKGMGDVLVIGGGVIPEDDIPGLEKAGVKLSSHLAPQQRKLLTSSKKTLRNNLLTAVID